MRHPLAEKTLMQAIVLRDHLRIAELAASGQHPLTRIELCIEIRGNAIDTLMKHVPRTCQVNVMVVTKVIAHLEAIERYPAALAILTDWLGRGGRRCQS
jgi:hypothetical protein